MSQHHKGHFALKACAISHGEVPTQACFDANPLTFIADELYGANVDPLYPERAYIPRTDFEGGLVRDGSGYLFHHRFQLPANLEGDLVLIQWHYVTGNSCLDVGYNTYHWPSGFYPGDLLICNQPLPEDGSVIVFCLLRYVTCKLLLTNRSFLATHPIDEVCLSSFGTALS